MLHGRHCHAAPPPATHLLCIAKGLCPRPALNLCNHALGAAIQEGPRDRHSCGGRQAGACWCRAERQGRAAAEKGWPRACGSRVHKGQQHTISIDKQPLAPICRISFVHPTPSPQEGAPNQISHPLSPLPTPPDVQHIIGQPVVPLRQHPRQLHDKHALSCHAGRAALLPGPRRRLGNGLPALQQGRTHSRHPWLTISSGGNGSYSAKQAARHMRARAPGRSSQCARALHVLHSARAGPWAARPAPTSSTSICSALSSPPCRWQNSRARW